jgi:hypothetical protein
VQQSEEFYASGASYPQAQAIAELVIREPLDRHRFLMTSHV